MSLVTFQQPRLLSQPPSRLPIDWGNGLTRGLVFSGYNAADDYMAPPVNYVTGIAGLGVKDVVCVTNSGAGAAPSFNGTTSGAAAPLDLSPYSLVTIAFWLRWNAFANDGGLCLAYGVPAGGSFPSALYLQPNEALGGWGVFNYNTDGSTFDRSTFTRPSAGAWHFYTFFIDRTVNLRPLTSAWVDVQIQTLGGSANFSPNSFVRNGNVGFCNRTSMASSPGAGQIRNVNIWNRFLDFAEMRSMYYDSLQILDPGTIMIGVPSAAAVSNNRWFFGA